MEPSLQRSMTIFTLVNAVHAKGIKLWHEDGQLKLKTPKGALTDDIREQLVANRHEIIEFLKRVSVTSALPSIEPVDRTKLDRLPLSYAQERLWFINQLEPDSAGYNCPGAATVSGELDVDQLERAFNLIIARHESLRTLFPSHEGQARQLILDKLDFKLTRLDLSHHEHRQARDAEARRLCQAEAATPFDLATGPLIRGKVIKLAADEHILMLNMHHIISDGWSIGVLIRELGAIMEAFRQGRNADLPPLPIQYVDYSVWQRKWLEEAGVLERQLAYWLQKLAGVPERVELATDYPRPSVQSFAGAACAFTLDAQLTGQLKSLAERHGCTLYMVLLAACKALLYRYTGQEDICVGSPVANRQYEQTEGLLGMFVNALALRSLVEGKDSFIALLSKVRSTCLEAYEHQDAPFEKVVDALRPDRNMAITPIFQIMVVLQDPDVAMPEQHIRPYPLESGVSKFDLVVEFSETSQGLAGSIGFSTALYKQQTIQRMAGHFIALCRAITAAPSTAISALSYMDEVERRRLLLDYNDTRAGYPRDLCIHQLVAAQVALDPNRTAVVFGEQELSYGQLHEESLDLSLYLQSIGVQPDCTVGLCIERSLEMMVGLLGVLQAGGAYVPLDPDYPDERLAYMLRDSRTTVVLTQEKLRDRLAALIAEDTRLVTLDRQRSQIGERVAALRANHVQLLQQVEPHHLAYVIYTSGSTGQPKGVMVEHRNLANLVQWHRTAFALQEGDRSSCLAKFGFDAATWEIWPSLCAGATVVLPSPQVLRDPEALLEWWQALPVDVSFLPTPLAEAAFSRGIRNAGLRALLIGGDRLHQLPVQDGSCLLINNYGPTECTVVATSGALQRSDACLHIGRPIANTQIYILDSQRQPVPVGVAGEIYIGGAGVARGYLNRPDLSAERFVADPFSSDAGARMYRTGDLARWLDDGNVEYIGRIDTQVKIRGFRIELGEIEARLNQYPQIENSVVVAHSRGADKQLVAFYRARGTAADRVVELPQDELKKHLLQALPAYMLPAAFVSLAAIPLTANGKLDRRALERMPVSVAASSEYLAPRSDAERELVEIWADVLQLAPEKIGVNDSFFELGGHSLLATQLTAKIRDRLQVDLPLRALFESASISQLAQRIAEAEKHGIPPIHRIDRAQFARLPLSFAQERLWFIDQLEPGSAAYNVPGAVTVRGELDIDQLQQAVNLLIARHENLRTVFPSHEGRAHQVILDSLHFELERVDLSHYEDRQARDDEARRICQAEAATPFDLATGPLIRGKAIILAAHEHILLLNVHHIVCDGWSLGILMGEFTSIMSALRRGERPQLPSLPIQYVDYSVWQRRWLEQGGILERQLAYWQEKLAGVPQSLDLMTDHPRPSVQSTAGATLAFTIDAQLTGQLKSLAEQQGCTLYMVLLAAFKVLLHRYTGQEDICLGSPIANRQYGETQGVIGMFVNTLALRSRVTGEDTFAGLLAKIKDTCLEAYEHQDAPFEKVVELVQPQRNMALSPLFQIMVILQNAPMGLLDPGIEPYPLRNALSNFDLTIELTETGEHAAAAAQLAGSIEYSVALYEQRTIARMIEHFVALCRAIVAAPTARNRELDYLGAAEKQRLLRDYNDTRADYPRDKCIHHLFAEQVAADPDRTALVHGDEQLSYRQLYDRSRDLALYLQSLGTGPDSLVGICVEKSLEMIVGILGILQAGGAYVPLDPSYPQERLAHMLLDSRAAIVLTQERLHAKLSALAPTATTLVALDRQWPHIMDRVAALKMQNVQLLQEVEPHHLAYVIYTSGSTGTPKGVMVEHRSLVNHNCYAGRKYRITKHDVQVQFSSMSFDLFVEEVFVILNNGARLILERQDDLLMPQYLEEVIAAHQVTTLNIPTAFFHQLVAQGARLDGIDKVIVGGEKLEHSRAREFIARFPDATLYNTYGPTETTIISTAVAVTSDLISRVAAVPIGSPIDNTQIYILDQHDRPVPVGVRGELHIAGDGLARGYLHRNDLTRQKFVDNPLVPGARMYKTGDLARWRDDGSIEYLGRVDTQIKIRGFRIDVAEIEAHLNRHPEISDSVIVAQGEAADQRLIAFYKAKDTTAEHVLGLARENLRAYLQQALPAHMLPAAFISLAAIPLTPNGKVDRRALELTDVSLESSQEYLGARNATEQQLVEIWSQVLKLEQGRVGVNDNFFELGGNSLSAVQVMAQVSKRFAQSLPLATFFTAPTIAALASAIFIKEKVPFDILVPIQTPLWTTSSLPPVFAVPGVGGNVLCLQPLGKAWGARRFYGLQAVGLDGKTAPSDSVERTAAANIAALRTIQAAGPYSLVGHSYGGVVAFEMARAMLEQGEEVASLVLLDSVAPSALREEPAGDEVTTLLDACTAIASLSGASLSFDSAQLRRISAPERDRYVLSRLNEHGLDISEQQLATYFRVYQANQRCYRGYRPARLPRSIDAWLFRAAQSRAENPMLPHDYGWSGLLRDPLRIHDVAADHFSMLEEAGAREIVAALSGSVRGAERP